MKNTIKMLLLSAFAGSVLMFSAGINAEQQQEDNNVVVQDANQDAASDLNLSDEGASDNWWGRGGFGGGFGWGLGSRAFGLGIYGLGFGGYGLGGYGGWGGIGCGCGIAMPYVYAYLPLYGGCGGCGGFGW